MDIAGKSISPSQYRYLLAAFVAGSSLLLSFMDNMVKQDSWLVVLASYVASAPFVLTYVMLAKKLPGKNLMQINDAVFGPVLGKVFSLMYIGYFFILLSFNLSDLSDYYIGSVSQETPKLPLIAITLLVAVYGVAKGLRPIAKAGFLSAVFSAIVIISTFLLLVKEMDFSNFLPVLESPPYKIAQSVHIFAALPYCEVFVFLMVMPSVGPGAKPGRDTFGGLLLGMVFLLAVSVRNTAVLGPSTALFTSNSYMAVRIINIGDFLTRVELFVAIGVIGALFMKITVLFFVLIKSLASVFDLKSPRALLVPVGGLAAVLALIAFSSTVSHAYAGMRYHAFFPLLFEFILPPVTLLVASIRRLDGKENTSDAG